MSARVFARAAAAGAVLLGLIALGAPRRGARGPGSAFADPRFADMSRPTAGRGPRSDGNLHVRIELDYRDSLDAAAFALDARLVDAYGATFAHAPDPPDAGFTRQGIEFTVSPPTTRTYLLVVTPRRTLHGRVIAWGPGADGQERKQVTQFHGGEASCFYVRTPQRDYAGLDVQQYFYGEGCGLRLHAWLRGKTGTDYVPEQRSIRAGSDDDRGPGYEVFPPRQ
ncbi:MAG TPA: hypothetical protein VNA89_16385 [Gemmatimonadaceae bacterium]|nr:hypothetical protein [Gemmatimonadaceae bacterium]